MKKVIFPGSFDPVTNGHIDLIKRAEKNGFYVIVVVHSNSLKKNMIAEEFRKSLIIDSLEALEDIRNVEVHISDKMIIDICDEFGCNLVLRGLRNEEDFSQEKYMATHNKDLNDTIETISFFTDNKYQHVSSSSVREILKYEKSIHHLVPIQVVSYIEEFRENISID